MIAVPVIGWNPELSRTRNFGPGDLHSLIHNVYSTPVPGVGPILSPPAPPFGVPGIPGWIGVEGGVIGWRDFFTYGITSAAAQWGNTVGMEAAAVAALPYGAKEICFLCGNFFPTNIPGAGHPGHSTVEHFLPSACAFILFGLPPKVGSVLNQEVIMAAQMNPLLNFDDYQRRLIMQNFGYAHSYCNSKKSDLLFLDVIRFSPNTIVQGAPPPYNLEFGGFNGVGYRPVTFDGDFIYNYFDELFSTPRPSTGKTWLKEVSLASNPLRPGQPARTSVPPPGDLITDYADGSMTLLLNEPSPVAIPPLANIYDNWELNIPWGQHAKRFLFTSNISPALSPIALTLTNGPALKPIQAYFYNNLRYALFKAVVQIYRIFTNNFQAAPIAGIGILLQPVFLQVDVRIQQLIASQALVVQGGGGIPNNSAILENIKKLTTDSHGELKLHPHDLTIICIGFYIDMYNDYHENKELYNQVIEKMNNNYKSTVLLTYSKRVLTPKTQRENKVVKTFNKDDPRKRREVYNSNITSKRRESIMPTRRSLFKGGKRKRTRRNKKTKK